MLISSFSDLFFPLFSDQNLFGLVILFIATSAVIYTGGLSILNSFVRNVSAELQYKRKDIRLMFKTVSILQYLIVLVLSVIAIQIVLQHMYSSSLVILVTIISYIPATLILGILSYRFIAWFRISKDAITFLFFLGSGMVAVNLGVGVVIHSYYIWSERSPIVTFASSQADPAFPKITPQNVGILSPLYLYAFFIPLNLAYFFAWAGCSVLLRYYSSIIGNIRYWIIISIPLVIFLGSIYPTLQSLSTGSFNFYDPDLIMYRVLFRVAGTIGGVFIFSFALLSISRGMKRLRSNLENKASASSSSRSETPNTGIEDQRHKEVSGTSSITADYMSLSAYGVAMLAVTVQASIIQTSYPPFGVSASSFVALASYLFSLGFYFSAISISQDMQLRQSIRKYVVQETKLLDNIGTAQMERQIQNNVVDLTRRYSDRMTRDTGVIPSLQEEEIRKYMHEVLVELGKIKES